MPSIFRIYTPYLASRFAFEKGKELGFDYFDPVLEEKCIIAWPISNEEALIKSLNKNDIIFYRTTYSNINDIKSSLLKKAQNEHNKYNYEQALQDTNSVLQNIIQGVPFPGESKLPFVISALAQKLDILRQRIRTLPLEDIKNILGKYLDRIKEAELNLKEFSEKEKEMSKIKKMIPQYFKLKKDIEKMKYNFVYVKDLLLSEIKKIKENLSNVSDQDLQLFLSQTNNDEIVNDILSGKLDKYNIDKKDLEKYKNNYDDIKSKLEESEEEFHELKNIFDEKNIDINKIKNIDEELEKEIEEIADMYDAILEETNETGIGESSEEVSNINEFNQMAMTQEEVEKYLQDQYNNGKIPESEYNDKLNQVNKAVEKNEETNIGNVTIIPNDIDIKMREQFQLTPEGRYIIPELPRFSNVPIDLLQDILLLKMSQRRKQTKDKLHLVELQKMPEEDVRLSFNEIKHEIIYQLTQKNPSLLDIHNLSEIPDYYNDNVKIILETMRNDLVEKEMNRRLGNSKNVEERKRYYTYLTEDPYYSYIAEQLQMIVPNEKIFKNRNRFLTLNDIYEQWKRNQLPELEKKVNLMERESRRNLAKRFIFNLSKYAIDLSNIADEYKSSKENIDNFALFIDSYVVPYFQERTRINTVDNMPTDAVKNLSKMTKDQANVIIDSISESRKTNTKDLKDKTQTKDLAEEVRDIINSMDDEAKKHIYTSYLTERISLFLREKEKDIMRNEVKKFKKEKIDESDILPLLKKHYQDISLDLSQIYINPKNFYVDFIHKNLPLFSYMAVGKKYNINVNQYNIPEDKDKLINDVIDVFKKNIKNESQLINFFSREEGEKVKAGLDLKVEDYIFNKTLITRYILLPLLKYSEAINKIKESNKIVPKSEVEKFLYNEDKNVVDDIYDQIKLEYHKQGSQLNKWFIAKIREEEKELLSSKTVQDKSELFQKFLKEEINWIVNILESKKTSSEIYLFLWKILVGFEHPVISTEKWNWRGMTGVLAKVINNSLRKLSKKRKRLLKLKKIMNDPKKYERNWFPGIEGEEDTSAKERLNSLAHKIIDEPDIKNPYSSRTITIGGEEYKVIRTGRGSEVFKNNKRIAEFPGLYPYRLQEIRQRLIGDIPSQTDSDFGRLARKYKNKLQKYTKKEKTKLEKGMYITFSEDIPNAQKNNQPYKLESNWDLDYKIIDVSKFPSITIRPTHEQIGIKSNEEGEEKQSILLSPQDRIDIPNINDYTWKAYYPHTSFYMGLNKFSRIVKRKDEWFVYSEDGKKKLGGPYKTKKEALERLRQIEYFKYHK